MFTTESNEPIGHDQTWLKDGGSGQTGRAIAKGPRKNNLCIIDVNDVK